MSLAQKKTTAPYPSVGADEEQSLKRLTNLSIATELVAALGLKMKPNALSMRLNVRAGKLQCEYDIRYESHRSHAGRTLFFTLGYPQA